MTLVLGCLGLSQNDHQDCHDAGEASGDSLGGQVLAALNADQSNLNISGVGGDAMQGQGLQPVFPMEELTVLGLSHAVKSYGRLKSGRRH